MSNNTETEPSPIIGDNTRPKLLPYQIDHINNLIHSLKTHNRCLDVPDTDTGKTYTSANAHALVNLKPLVICPESVITNWTNVLTQFGVEYYGISNYESIQNCKVFTIISKNKKLDCSFVERIEVILNPLDPGPHADKAKKTKEKLKTPKNTT